MSKDSLNQRSFKQLISLLAISLVDPLYTISFITFKVEEISDTWFGPSFRSVSAWKVAATYNLAVVSACLAVCRKGAQKLGNQNHDKLHFRMLCNVEKAESFGLYTRLVMLFFFIFRNLLLLH